MLLRELDAEPVYVVVVTTNSHQLGAVNTGCEDLLLLQVRRHEHVGVQTCSRRVRGDRVREVTGRGAGHHLVVQFPGLRHGHVHDAILERVGRVGGVVLHIDLGKPKPPGKLLRSNERRHPDVQRCLGTLRKR
jgi:hypothetical protein